MFINNFDPVALEIFSLEIRWYSLAYIMGILIGWFLAKKFLIGKNIYTRFDDYITYVIIGLILGGRFGYVLFYNLGFYINNPLDVFKLWQGGMSFHGGVLGIIIASILFAKKNNDDVYEYLDVIALVAPIGIFFGRLANFINSELYGYETNLPWGVKFVQVDDLYRHPTQLYEAFFEGFVLFFVLLFFRKKERFKIAGILSSFFLIFYSIFRFIIEYFRVPDEQLGYLILNATMGQIISFVFFVAGIFLLFSNISRLFSEMIAIWTIDFWENLGCPKKFNLIELGAGNGEMMKIMIESFKRFPTFLNCCKIIIHEKSPKLIKIQKDKIQYKNVEWIKNFKSLNKLPSIFLANEFFDAIPIKQFTKEKKIWYERLVKSSKNSLIFDKKKINIKKLENKTNFKFLKNQNFIEYSPKGIKYLKDIMKFIDRYKGGLLIIDYGYYEEKFQNTLKAIYNKKHSNLLENIGKSDITYNINYHLFDKIVKSNKNLNNKYTTQKKFLTNLGIFQRAEILSKNKKFSEKADIFYRIKRLTDDEQMGDLFKVMLIKNSSIKSQLGFEN